MGATNYNLQLSELEQVRYGEAFFTDLGYKIYTEVPIFSSSADMILIDSNNHIQAIEFKLKNWRRAIQQVKKHSIVVDYISICILKPKKRITCEQIERCCKEEGIGLYYLNEHESNIEQIVSGSKSKNVWEVEKERLLEYIK